VVLVGRGAGSSCQLGTTERASGVVEAKRDSVKLRDEVAERSKTTDANQRLRSNNTINASNQSINQSVFYRVPKS